MRDTQSSAHQSERRLVVEYAKFREAEALRLFDALPAVVLRGLNDKKQNLLRQEGRLDRMALDVRRREGKNLILLDIERELRRVGRAETQEWNIHMISRREAQLESPGPTLPCAIPGI